MSNNNKSPSKKFDVQEFNKQFELDKEQRKLIAQEKDLQKLRQLNETIVEKKLYENTVSDIIIGIKNSWFNLLDDLLEQKFSISIFTRENRLFYIGITLIIMGLLIYLYNFFLEDGNEYEQKNTEKIIEKYYIYGPSKHIKEVVTNNE